MLPNLSLRFERGGTVFPSAWRHVILYLEEKMELICYFSVVSGLNSWGLRSLSGDLEHFAEQGQFLKRILCKTVAGSTTH